MKVLSPLIAALAVVFWGSGITTAPSQQITPLPPGIALQATLDGHGTQYAVLSTEIYVERQINRDQSTLNAAMWSTLDTLVIGTQVATLISLPASATPSPVATNTPSATRTPVIAAPSVTMTPSATQTPQGTAPAPTIEDVSTPPEGDLVVFYANATSGNVNRRACAGTSCPVVGTLALHGTLGLCANSAKVVGNYEWWKIATPAGIAEEWIAVRNVTDGALLMASLNHEQMSTDTDC